MTQPHWIAVDNYINDLFVPGDAALAAADAAGLPPIQVSPSQGKLLFVLAKAMGARRILEIGTLAGYSTIWLARALPAGGAVVTIEISSLHADVARGNFVRAGVADVVDLRVGRALDVLPNIAGPFDLIFIDADKPGYPEYLEWAIRLARPGTLIIADNVVRDGAIIDAASTDPNVQAMRRFNIALAADTRVTATTIQTVGAKGYDGFAAIVVQAS
jgi:predicted O-methyltransferase YrrM